MNEDAFNMSMRKFLKRVGVTSQREIEAAVQRAQADGALNEHGVFKIKMTLESAELGLVHAIEGEINLDPSSSD